MMGPALSQKTNKMWIMFVDLVLQTNNTAPVLHGFCKTFNNFSTNLLRDMFEPNPVISGSVSWSCPCIPCNSFQSFVQTFLRMVFVAWVGLFVFCVGVPCSMPASVVGGFVVHASWLALYIYIYIILLVQPKKFRHKHILRIQIMFSGKCFLKTNGVHSVFFNRGQASKMCVFGIRLEPALTYVFHQPAPPVSSQTKKTL